MPTIASNYRDALQLACDNDKKRFLHYSENLLEVNADGSIRTQNWREKLVNFGSRLVGNFQTRSDKKDAAVAIALQKLFERYVPNPNPSPNDNPEPTAPEGYGFLDRYRQALARIEQRVTPRNVVAGNAQHIAVNQSAASTLNAAVQNPATAVELIPEETPPTARRAAPTPAPIQEAAPHEFDDSHIYAEVKSKPPAVPHRGYLDSEPLGEAHNKTPLKPLETIAEKTAQELNADQAASKKAKHAAEVQKLLKPKHTAEVQKLLKPKHTAEVKALLEKNNPKA